MLPRAEPMDCNKLSMLNGWQDRNGRVVPISEYILPDSILFISLG